MGRKIGFIPVRKESKRIPHKNFKMIAGKKLFQWVVEAALKSNLDAVYLYSDDEKIRNHAYWLYRSTDLYILNRFHENATDTSTTEQAMLDFTDDVLYNEIYLLQATSPMTTPHDINRAIQIMKSHDSIVSVVKQKRFIWDSDAEPVNYHYENRPISQNYKGFLVENGAIYGTKRHILKTQKCRLGGNIGLVIMPEKTYIEIDTPEDFVMVESLLERRKNESD